MASSGQTNLGINMSEAWLIKALRLLHSESQEDTTRLRKLYKDACENEASIFRITLSDALRSEPPDDSSATERVSSRFRISAPSNLGTSDGSAPTDSSSTSSVIGLKPSSKLINLSDLPTTPASSKARSSLGSTNMIPLMVSQGKTVIPDQSASVIMTSSDILGNTNVEANATPLAMEAMEDLVADCRCCVCGLMIPTSNSSSGETAAKNNGLVECSHCGGLYHQLCHNPPLPTSRVPSEWICSRCSEVSSSSPKRPTPTSSSMETKKSKM